MTTERYVYVDALPESYHAPLRTHPDVIKAAKGQTDWLVIIGGALCLAALLLIAFLMGYVAGQWDMPLPGVPS